MKTIIILSTFLLFFRLVGFSQEQENGTIYIKHPYIEIVNKSVQSYNDKNWEGEKQLYSDTAKFWASGMEKPVAIADAFKMFSTDFDFFDSVKQVKAAGSYPDYLHYKDQDAKSVQSWWLWSGKSKKTGEMVKVYCVQFDDFNSAGKISRESIYGDFSKMFKEKQ